MAAHSNVTPVTQKKVRVRFVQERETKGTIRYKEVKSDLTPVESENLVIGTLYIKKRPLGGSKPPKKILVSMTYMY